MRVKAYMPQPAVTKEDILEAIDNALTRIEQAEMAVFRFKDELNAAEAVLITLYEQLNGDS